MGRTKTRPVSTASLPQAHQWMPTSPCGPDCIDEDLPSVGRIRTAGRLATAVVVLLAAILTSPLLAVLHTRGRERWVRALFGGIMRAFGVRMVVHGREGMVRNPKAPARGIMQVNNHISWIDILALNTVQPMRALAKSELATWPLLGRVIRGAGTVFVDREHLRTIPKTVAELAEAYRSGSMVNVAGEGTTWCGRASGRYVPAPFQAAIDGGAAILPVALRYRVDGGRQTTGPAFIGTESLLASLLRVAKIRGLVVELFVCAEIPPGTTDNRRELADLTESAVLSALGTTAFLRATRFSREPGAPDPTQPHGKAHGEARPAEPAA